jgi:hypothetical protein
MSDPGSTGSGYSQQGPANSASDWAARQFQIWQTLSRVRTMVMVQVTAVNGGNGAIAAPPTVSVKPLVKIVDGQGNTSSHGTINNVPVFRLGSKFGSVILDPEVGDVGVMAIADRDSSVVVSTKGKESQPGSRRMFDLADGVYLGMLFGAAPTQYVSFTENGLTIKSGSDGINLNGLIINQQGQVQGDLDVTGEVKRGVGGADQVTLGNHVHPANGQPPTPGT